MEESHCPSVPCLQITQVFSREKDGEMLGGDLTTLPSIETIISVIEDDKKCPKMSSFR